MDSRYSFELWSPGGDLLADLTGLARQRQVTLGRNEADEISFEVDLAKFEEYARSINTLPSSLIIPGSTEVRVKRGQSYLAGGQVVYAESSLTARGASMQVRALGFLNLFKDRMTAPMQVYNMTDRGEIAADLVEMTQAQGAEWDFGVTVGSVATIGDYSITYQNANVKQALQELADLQGGLDFEFTPDKVFNVYTSIGSVRPELIFEYPGNIRSFRAPLDATNIANRIYLLGRGTGDESATFSMVEDTISQIDYKVRERSVQLSDILDAGTLDDYGYSELDAWSRPFLLPTLEVPGNTAPFVTDYGVGDYVTVRVKGYEYLSEVDGLYRVERKSLSISDDDDELVRLTVSR